MIYLCFGDTSVPEKQHGLIFIIFVICHLVLFDHIFCLFGYILPLQDPSELSLATIQRFSSCQKYFHYYWTVFSLLVTIVYIEHMLLFWYPISTFENLRISETYLIITKILHYCN